MSLFLANRISKPITALNEVVGKISKGELDTNVKKRKKFQRVV